MTVLMLGIVNWIATTILVDGEIFRPLRKRVTKRWKLNYLVSCHLCAGTWVGFALAVVTPLRPIPAPPIVDIVLAGLLYKGIGHLLLALVNLSNRIGARNE